MFLSKPSGEVGISVDDIHHHRTPGHNVAVLGILFETDEAANDIRTETRKGLAMNNGTKRN